MSLSARYSKPLRWYFDFKNWNPSVSEWVECGRYIQNEERCRISNYYYRKDAKASMAGRLMMRKAIIDSIGIGNKNFLLERTSKGKPYLPKSDYNFSVSHAGDLTVLASNYYGDVGIDVMKIDRPLHDSLPAFFSKMKRNFSDIEMDRILQQDTEENQMKMFYRIWCLKESFVKAKGVGIGFELKRMSFNVCSPLIDDLFTIDTELYVDGKLDPNWQFQETVLCKNHVVAVGIQLSDYQLKPNHLPSFVHLDLSLLNLDDSLSPPDEKFRDSYYHQE